MTIEKVQDIIDKEPVAEEFQIAVPNETACGDGCFDGTALAIMRSVRGASQGWRSPRGSPVRIADMVC